MASRRALGRGLGDVFAETLGSRRTLALTNIEPNPRQPRQGLVEAELEGLAASIRRYGVLQPIVVSERADHPGRFYLVAGRASLASGGDGWADRGAGDHRHRRRPTPAGAGAS